MFSWIKRLFERKEYLTKAEGELIFSAVISIARKYDLQPEELERIMEESFLNEMYAYQLAELLKQRKGGVKK